MSFQQVRSNVNAYPKARIPKVMTPSTYPVSGGTKDAFSTYYERDITELENEVEEFKGRMEELHESKIQADKRAMKAETELKRARDELVYLRERLDTSHRDLMYGRKLVESIPDRIAAEAQRLQKEEQKGPGNSEQLMDKITELERKLKTTEEKCLVSNRMLQGFTTEMKLEKAISAKLLEELVTLKNRIENILSEANRMRINYEANPGSSYPSSASAVIANGTMDKTPRPNEVVSLPDTDLEELEDDDEEELAPTSQPAFMMVVNNIPDDKWAELGILDDDDEF